VVGDDDVLEVGEVAADLFHLLVEGGSGDEHAGATVLKAVTDGLRPEGGEERPDDAEVLEGTEDGGVELRGAVHEDEDAVGLLNVEAAQDVREFVRHALQVRVGVVFHVALGADPAEGDFVRGLVGVAVDCFVGEVEAAAVGKAVQLGADVLPGVGGAARLPIVEVRRDGELVQRWLDDRLVVHGRSL
jgi:hypothetical protein